MAIRIPLVQVGGQIQQLQSGDSIANVEIPQFTNANAVAIVIGTPVYSSANDNVDKAQANALATTDVIGLVADTSIAAGATGGIQLEGILTATTGQWDAVAGTTGGLTKNTIYYLSASTAGQLTATSPSTAGQYSASVGIAVSTTEMKIDVRPRILL